jgi:hypothetical protein
MGMSWAGLEGRPYTSGYVLNGFEHRSRRIIRRRQQLQNRQRTVCDVNAICECPAGVDGNAHESRQKLFGRHTEIFFRDLQKIIVRHDAVHYA